MTRRVPPHKENLLADPEFVRLMLVLRGRRLRQLHHQAAEAAHALGGTGDKLPVALLRETLEPGAEAVKERWRLLGAELTVWDRLSNTWLDKKARNIGWLHYNARRGGRRAQLLNASADFELMVRRAAALNVAVSPGPLQELPPDPEVAKLVEAINDPWVLFDQTRETGNSGIGVLRDPAREFRFHLEHQDELVECLVEPDPDISARNTDVWAWRAAFEADALRFVQAAIDTFGCSVRLDPNTEVFGRSRIAGRMLRHPAAGWAGWYALAQLEVNERLLAALDITHQPAELQRAATKLDELQGTDHKIEDAMLIVGVELLGGAYRQAGRADGRPGRERSRLLREAHALQLDPPKRG